MKTIIVIPSRLDAQRLPRKPLIDIRGLPMVIQVMKRAEEANIGEIYVACCGDEIADTVTQHGGKAIKTDPALPSGTDRVWACAQQTDADIIINLQGDLPFVSPDTIKATAELLADYKQFDIGTPSYQGPATFDPSNVTIALSEINQTDSEALYFSRQSIPHGATVTDHHIGIYAYRRECLEKFCNLKPHPLEQFEKLEQLRALGNGMKIGVRRVNDHPRSVDTKADWEALR